MVEKRYFCNRCGKEISTRGSRIIPSYFDIKGMQLVSDGADFPEDDVHFCLRCTGQILKEIRRPPAEKKKTPKKRMRIDAAKVITLHQEGWSNREIAEEMKVSERQVYECIRYQTNKLGSYARAGKE